MIKIVASDLDGTLLNSHKELTPRTKKAIRALLERDIRFVAASGRQHFNLFEEFEKEGFGNEITFLAENGAILFDRGENIFVDRIAPELVREVVVAARQLGAYPVLDGVQAAYYEDDDPELLSNVKRYFAKWERLDDVLECLKYDSICKIALLDVHDAEHGIYPAMQFFTDRAQVLLSGPEWVDVINHGVSKGVALQFLCKRYGVKEDEVMVFGDYLNDLEMMKICDASFAMKNAHPLLKEVANYQADSNDNDGVAKVLEEWLELGN